MVGIRVPGHSIYGIDMNISRVLHMCKLNEKKSKLNPYGEESTLLSV